MSPTPVEERVAEILATWVRRSTANSRFPRVNLRFVLSEHGAYNRVRELLAESGDPGRTYCVRTSSDAEAVRYRNGTPPDTDPSSTFVFVLFWTPGVRGHEHNAQSLQDLRAVDVRDVLAADVGFELPLESAIYAQVDDAARSWPEAHQGRAREHLRHAWRSLTTCLRTRNGGRERSVPFIRSIESYVRFLDSARVPEGPWRSMEAVERPSAMVRQWGRALAELQMFQMPELGLVLGVSTTPTTPVPTPSKTREALWEPWIREWLADNLEYALDPTGLGDALAGKSELEDQLTRLKHVPLCRDEAAQLEARTALLRFCRDNDEAALRRVEWVFYKDPTNRRTQTFGLRGLLMARNQRAPRLSPLERARIDTIEIFERTLGKGASEVDDLKRFVEEQSTEGAKGLQTLCDTFIPFANGELPEAPPELRKALERAMNASGWRPKLMQQAASRWERLRKRDSNDRVEEAPTVLLGLLRLVWHWAMDRGGAEGGAVDHEGAKVTGMLRVTFEGRAPQSSSHVDLDPLDPPRLLQELCAFLTKRVQPVVNEEVSRRPDEDDEDDEEAVSQILGFFVERSAGKDREPIGRVEVAIRPRVSRLWEASRGDVLVRWERDSSADLTHTGGPRLLDAIERAIEHGQLSSSPDNDALNQCWAAYVRDANQTDGWELLAPVSPVPDSGKRWVEAWAEALREVEASVASEHASDALQRLRAALQDALDREDYGDAKKQNEAIRAKEAETAKAPKPLAREAVRRLLAQNTVAFRDTEGNHLRAMLSPHHPLVMRLRALEDDLFVTILRDLWNGAWPDAGRGELAEALEKSRSTANWGLPEPMHAWCAWDGAPLVFEGWLDGSWCSFARLDSGRDADAATIGVRTVSQVINQYRALFPSASDRLRLRMRGDRDGAWAWRILDEQLSEESGFSADVDLVTDLSDREPTEIDVAVLHHRERIEDFELGVNGALPHVRVRRVRPGDGAPARAHLTLAVGEQIDALNAEWRDEPATGTTSRSIWERDALFHETLPEAKGHEELVRDPDDPLCRLTAIAIGIGRGHAGRVTVERHSFDPSRCEVPLRNAQSGAHWLVLASRRPLYRAVQQVGSRVATLLDFRTVIERGRAVHVAVSLNAERDTEDLRGLASRLRSLTGEGDIESARAMIRFAQRVAPGLALRAIASTGGGDLVGLIGLLLSAHLTLEQQDNGVVLSLDQHQALLESRMRGDLLVVRLTERGVGLSVVEAKCSTDRQDDTSARTTKATAQLKATLDGLGRFQASHPLSARSRLRLARALIHQGHMLAIDDGRAEELKELVRRVRTPTTPIELGPHTANAVLLWSFSDLCSDTATHRDGSRVQVYGRASTLDRLGKLVGDHRKGITQA